MASDNEIGEMREELAAAREEIASLKVKATTTLSGNEFITIILIGPVIAAFVILGIIIVWKTTSNPVSGALGAVVGKFADEKSRKKENET